MLALTVLLNGACSLVIGLAVSYSFGLRVNLRVLCEYIPYLVIALGFEKHYILTKAVFQTMEYQDLKDRVIEGASRVAPMIITDYVLEIVVFGLAAMFGISGLKEFCVLSALILIVDCIFLFTSYLAILSLKMEVPEDTYLTRLIFNSCFI